MTNTVLSLSLVASLTLNWSYTNDTNYSYIVHYGITPYDLSQKIESSSTNVVITNLYAGHTYHFAVSAIDKRLDLESEVSSNITYTIPIHYYLTVPIESSEDLLCWQLATNMNIRLDTTPDKVKYYRSLGNIRMTSTYRGLDPAFPLTNRVMQNTNIRIIPEPPMP